MMKGDDVEVNADHRIDGGDCGDQKGHGNDDDEDEAVVVDVDDDSEALLLTTAPSTSDALNERKSQSRASLSMKASKASVISPSKGAVTKNKYHLSDRTPVGKSERYVTNIEPYTTDGVASAYCSGEIQEGQRISRSQANLESMERTNKVIRDQWRAPMKEENELLGGTFLQGVSISEWKRIDKKDRSVADAEQQPGLNSIGKQWPMNDKINRRSVTKRKQPSCDGSVTASTSSSVPIFSARSKRLTLSSIVVPEEDEQLVRVYRFNSKSRDGRTIYYRCSKCDTLCNNDKKSGIVRSTVLRASLKTVNGQIAGDAHPKHHPECKPISAQTLKVQEIDKSCRVRVKEGILTPKQAWSMGRRMAMEQSGNEESNADSVPFPDWKKLRRKYSELERGRRLIIEQNEDLVYGDDEINVGSMESVPMESGSPDAIVGTFHSCSCKQYYEANVQIYENIVNCLEEMRAIREEIRQVYDESRHFDVEEPLYQVIEEQ